MEYFFAFPAFLLTSSSEINLPPFPELLQSIIAFTIEYQFYTLHLFFFFYYFSPWLLQMFILILLSLNFTLILSPILWVACNLFCNENKLLVCN